MPKRKDPVFNQVILTLGAYYALRGSSGDDGLSSLPEHLRVAMAVRLESTIQRAAAPGSVHRELAESSRLLPSESERIPKLVGVLVALLTELSSESQSNAREETSKLYRILKLNYPGEFAVLEAVRRAKPTLGPVASRQAIESCRNAFENFFKTLGGTPKWSDQLDPLLGDKSLAKLARDVYAFLSTNGTHAATDHSLGASDLLLALRLTEAMMVRVLVRLGKW